ncbi:MAG: DUF86 domain-containing protein [Candidatus Accumulibacter sp.]|jgi:uncharacterized protein with HEPN domain|nr:DUF86 domain-containing protein [Accumulibacter sp.]
MSIDKQGVADCLSQILQAIERIGRYTDAIDVGGFLQNEMVQDAVIRNIEIIGKAGRDIERAHPDFAEAHPELPVIARRMGGLAAHGRFRVDLETVWKSVRNDLTGLYLQTQDAQQNLSADGREDVSPDGLPRWAAGFPGLIWQVEIPASRISIIKNWHHPELGADTAQLLRYRAYRKAVVMREDLPTLEAFWDVMFSRESAAVSFRLRADPQRPLMLQGWGHPRDNRIYCGYLQYDDTRETLDDEGGRAMPGGPHIQRSRQPVFIVNLDKQVVQRMNKAAENMFHAGSNPVLHIQDIAPGEQGEKLLEASAQALEDDVWSGALSFVRSSGNSSFAARVRISNCSEGNSRMLRVSFLGVPRNVRHEASAAPPTAFPNLLDVVEACPDLRSSLAALLDKAGFPAMDGLMFSDIMSDKGKVQVYGVGKAFEGIPMPWGEIHDYEGTIAQDIERFDLRSLLMDDTRDSIKSIDWVLFLPHGIRSYFAKPFFEDNRLRAVMILSSFAPHAFPPNSENLFKPLYPAFAKAVERWRGDRK